MGVVYAAIYPIHKSGNWKPRGMTHMLALHSVMYNEIWIVYWLTLGHRHLQGIFHFNIIDIDKRINTDHQIIVPALISLQRETIHFFMLSQ